MTFKINALKTIVGNEEFVLLDNIFNSAQEALDFVKVNLSLNDTLGPKNVVSIKINDVYYHYFEIIEG